MTTTKKALCQDCLRECDAAPDNLGTCPKCGGDTCSCRMCTDALHMLHAGTYSFFAIAAARHITGPITWTPDDGVVYGESK